MNPVRPEIEAEYQEALQDVLRAKARLAAASSARLQDRLGTYDRNQQIIGLVREGEVSLRRIAQLHGLSVSSLYKLLEAAGEYKKGRGGRGHKDNVGRYSL